jgi:S-adenosylmethionine hydrolase
VEFFGSSLPLLDHYAQAQPGEALALPGSFGFLEIAVRDGSAQARFAARIGAPVQCRPATA